MRIQEELLKRFDELKENAEREKNHCLYWNSGIFRIPDRKSDARYPYVKDGRVLWTHACGKISRSESDFFYFPDTVEGETSFLSFFLGIKGKKSYYPVSLFDFDRNLFEQDAERGVFFSYHSVTYILKTAGLAYLVTRTLDDKKELLIYGKIMNCSDKEAEVYSSRFRNPRLRHSNYSSVETKWFKKCEYKENRFRFDTTEDLSIEEHLFHHYWLERSTVNVEKRENTTSRLSYCDSKVGDKNSSPCLLKGRFNEEKYITCFSDTAIAGDFLKSTLQPKESREFSYQLTSANDFLSLKEIKEYLSALPLGEKNYDRFSFQEGNKMAADKFTNFSKRLLKQVDYCASTKNSTLRMLGFRDIFQALEAAVIFNPSRVREKILGCLDYVSITGRCPRQFAWSDGESVRIDSREFIDQGLWVVDCLYQYLSYTDDFSILSVKRRYIEINPDGTCCFAKEQDDVLSHLKRIRNYLIGNIDSKTGCLKALYGDWNDAIDGLGKTKGKPGFGNGVSIMATFQLYSALTKAMEIFSSVKKDDEWIEKAKEAKKKVDSGLWNHAFVEKNGKWKIIHGWGNDQAFFVGSFDDIDHKSRDTLTSNSFYILSGFYQSHPEYVPAVLNAYHNLEGKYGFKTFDPFFGKESSSVGRIVNLPKGTAENAATYIHASVFALDSLFMINQPERAWEERNKLVPFTHEFISTTPFVMPNSYVYNPEIGCDGESRNDWFTGSSSTLLKSLVRNAFGFDPHLNGLHIHPATYFPFEKAEMKIKFRNKTIVLRYKKANKGRNILLNGEKRNLVEEQGGFRKKTAIIPYSLLKEDSIIEIEA